MRESRSILFVCTLFFILLFGSAHGQNLVKSASIGKIVIDAGHGGKDPGTVCKHCQEKDINLAVALRLGELINENFPEIEVIYTRKTDVLIDLYERGDIANRAGADLFISIHVNAAKSTAAGGTETLVMGADKAGKNLDIAMRENDVIIYEDDYSTKYEGYTPGSTESFIMFSLMQYTYQGQSIKLANLVQKQFSNKTNMVNRGVKQAPILVLWRTAMPSILTEFGFLSNAKEARFIGSRAGQDMYAHCIFNAFSEYKASIEGKSSFITKNSALKYDESAEQPETPQVSAETTGGIIFAVQIASSTSKIDINCGKYRAYKEQIVEKKIGKSYKYTIGCTASHKEALSLQGKLRKIFRDAFIVAFDGESQISVDKARAMTR